MSGFLGLNFGVVILGLVLAFRAEASSEAALNHLLKDVESAYSWWCRGDACKSVFAEQVRSLDALSNFVDQRLLNDLSLAPNTGKRASSLVKRVCVNSTTADNQTLIWLVNAENRAMSRLVTIQRLANVPVINCQKALR